MLAALGTTAVTVYMGLKAAREKGEISEQEYQESVRAINKLEQELKSLRPDETWENIDPQLLQKAAEYSPDIAAFVEENAPQLITEAGAAAERRIQRQALQKYAAQAETGRDVIADAQREQAIFESGTRAKQRQQALMQKMKQQGMLGSGAELAAQLQIEQAEAQAAREQSLRGVQEAEMRRRQALGEAAQLAGQMRSQALNVESANVSTMNAYNQRLANAKNLYNRYASGARNEAQLENQRREIARQSANIQLANEYAKFNRQQQEAARERARQYDVDVAKTIFGKRQGAESGKYDAKRQGIADRTTAWTSGIGTGIGAYGALSAASAAGAGAAASGAKEAYFKSLLKSAGQGITQGAAESATRSAFAPSYQPQYMEEQEQISGREYFPNGSSTILGTAPTEENWYGPVRPKKPRWTEEELID